MPNNGLMTDDDVKTWFVTTSEVRKEEYIDERVPLVKKASALLEFWRELSMVLERARVGYSLAVRWKDEALISKCVAEAKPQVARIEIIEEELKLVLPQLKNVDFLSQNELRSLPVWMLELLEVRIT